MSSIKLGRFWSQLELKSCDTMKQSICGWLHKYSHTHTHGLQHGSEDKLQSHYYIHFQTNTLEQVMNPLIPSPRYSSNSTTTILLQGWLWNNITHKGWYAIKQRSQTKYTYRLKSSFHIYIEEIIISTLQLYFQFQLL